MISLLTVFGIVAITAMIVCDTLERKYPIYTLFYAFACWASAAYGFLQGAWPFGVLEVIWGGIKIWQFIHK